MQWTNRSATADRAHELNSARSFISIFISFRIAEPELPGQMAERNLEMNSKAIDGQ
jgi:hypothetical protein